MRDPTESRRCLRITALIGAAVLIAAMTGGYTSAGESSAPKPRPLRPNCWYLRSASSDDQAVRIPANEGQSVRFFTWIVNEGPQWVSLGEGPFVLALIPLGIDDAGGTPRRTRDGSGSIYGLLVQRHEVTRFDAASDRPAATRVVEELRWSAPERAEGQSDELFPAGAIRFQAAPFRYCVLLHLRAKAEPLPAALRAADRTTRLLDARLGLEVAELWDKPDPAIRLRYPEQDVQPSTDWYQQMAVKAPWTAGIAPWSGAIRLTAPDAMELLAPAARPKGATPVDFDDLHRTAKPRAGAAEGPLDEEP